MPNYKIARLVKNRDHYRCEMCNKYKMAKVYEYQSVSYVRDYIPHHYKKLCGDCVYRTAYGTKQYKKMKKEGVLDK